MNIYSLFALLDVGEISVSDAGSTIGSLNDILKNVGTAVGAVVIVIAIVKLIIALAQESPESKTQSSLMFGVGIVFVSMSRVLTSLGVEDIDSSTKATTMAANVLNVIASMLTYVGVIVLSVAIIYLIMSIATEHPEQKITGSKLLGVSVGLFSAKGLTNAIKTRMFEKGGSTAANYVNDILGFIADVVSYIGAAFVIMGIWNFINGFKTEDDVERAKATKFFVAGIALLSFKIILSNIFNINVRSAVFSI